MTEIIHALSNQINRRVKAEFAQTLANCEAEGWKAGWHQLKDKLDEFTAAMDKAVAENDLQPIRDTLAEYRKPVRITWHY